MTSNDLERLSRIERVLIELIHCMKMSANSSINTQQATALLKQLNRE